MRAVLRGQDALGVLPTGGGKSVCYQVPALCFEGMTLVVTPLISLMEDQVERASEAGLRSAYLSATQGAPTRARVLKEVAGGRVDILFVSPERLQTPVVRDSVAEWGVRLVAVDEAHCISQWGHDFRPAYRTIARIRERVRCPLMALTATATPQVRADITDNLELVGPETVVQSFDRANLAWHVDRIGPREDRVVRIYRVLRANPGTAVVYAPTRRAVEAVRDGLAGRGLRTESYHAGLDGPERSRVQAAFMAGACRVVVATNAFGMGIDKPDVRVVAHVQLPTTLEAYYQEAGRAGRDGADALCFALDHPTDARLGHGFIDRTHPPLPRLRRLLRKLRRHADADGHVEVLPESHAKWVGRHALPDDVRSCLEALGRCGVVRLDERDSPNGEDTSGPGGVGPVRLRVRPSGGIELATTLRRAARDKLRAVRRYAAGRGCRRRALLGYFGEEGPARCGGCDRCRGR